MSENKKEVNMKKKILVDDLDIIVTGSMEKPYFQIKYHEHGSAPDHYDVGFGSYCLDNVFEWKEEYFEIYNGVKDPGTTNNDLLEHLQEVEVALSCIVTAMNTLFVLISDRAEMFDLDNQEKQILKSGQLAMIGCTRKMSDLSGVEEKAKKEKERFMERHGITGDEADGIESLLKLLFS